MKFPKILRYQKREFSDTKQFKNILSLSEEVRNAIEKCLPIVALESTIISHGMPYPRNIEVALEVEECVRKAGAVPATIAIINGIPKIGISKEDLFILANNDTSNPSTTVIKASRRDLAYACTNKLHAATTVASTMILAHRAGIKIFATGGIGGVHRGAENTFDVSADLYELGKTPVAVVCAGIKSILDIPKTLEVLETQGVPVIGYKCHNFPAFYTNDSGIASPLVAHDTLSIANMILNADILGLHSGMVIGVPNPYPADSIVIQEAIDEATRQVVSKGISGQAVTPFVLSMVEKLTKGKSLDSNISLILNNAKIASEIAKDFSSLSQPPEVMNPHHELFYSLHGSEYLSKTLLTPAPIHESSLEGEVVAARNTHVLVFGGAVIDMIGKSHSKLIMKSSNPGKMRTSYGGVARNIAERLSRYQFAVSLLSAVADDIGGHGLIKHADSFGIDTSKIIIVPTSTKTNSLEPFESTISPEALNTTATYTAIHDADGDLSVGIADMGILEKITPQYINARAEDIRLSDLVISDGNLSQESFVTLMRICHSHSIPVFFEPTSDHKCLLPVHTKSLQRIDVIKPNFSELKKIMSTCLDNDMVITNKASVKKALESCEESNNIDDSFDIVDVRILACGLLQLMNMQSFNEVGSSSRSPNLTSEGKNRRVRGKHVIVSLGSRGIMWCGPKNVLGKDADTIVDDHIACRYIPSTPLQSHEIVHTNGAGDAFCAGFLASLLHLPSTIDGPNLQCIEQGMKAAKDHMTSACAI